MNYNKFNDIKHLIFDVDGVLTNCRLIITEAGEFLRTMNVRDGAAMKMAQKAGLTVSIITKGNSIGVRDRLQFLGCDPIYDDVRDKSVALADLELTHKVDLSRSLYMGDDLADLVVFPRVLLATCPHDATPEVIEAAEYVSAKCGGDGCVRDVIERVMRAQGLWGIID